MKDGDILLYMDCGCELNYLAKLTFLEKLEIVKKKIILGSSACKQRYYNKSKLIKHFQIDNHDYLDMKQNAATQILIYKNDMSKDLVDKWYNICENYELIDDSVSERNECAGFI